MKININQKKDVLIIVGPTAVGKTSLSLNIADEIESEIVSADSRQVYKLMNIGTAKPTADEQLRAVHHFIDIKYPDEYYSAGQYAREARSVIDTIRSRDRLAIVVGGSGLYIRALVDGFFEDEVADEAVKQSLRKIEKENGLTYLYEKLSEIDPQLAQKLHPNDSQRIKRALEVWEISGKRLSDFQKKPNNPADFNPVFIGLSMEREVLYQRIEDRVDKMLEKGLIDEVRHISKLGYSKNLPALQTVGYKEVFQLLDGEINRERMVELIKQKSRNYAKRQITWFNKDQRIQWYNITKTGKTNSPETTIVTFVNN
ncbi:tRNA (adenosine(37)-N6)-dimethylallyltransferase MiaA [candidate division KSB1 bacterium]|nr:tRNA (adenosine(37)-N6)-dimethylallyltransferase MiaA [candidate division KSB1 bacterium]